MKIELSKFLKVCNQFKIICKNDFLEQKMNNTYRIYYKYMFFEMCL